MKTWAQMLSCSDKLKLSEENLLEVVEEILAPRFATASLGVSAAAIFPVPEKSKNKMYCQ